MTYYTMRVQLLGIDKWLRGLSPLSFIIVMSLVSLFAKMILAILFFLFQIEIPVDDFQEWNVPLFIIFLLFIGPIIETLLAQTGIIYLCTKYFKLNNWIAVIISATVFALGHYSSWITILFAFSSGLIYAYSFVIYREKNFSPTLMVIILHVIRNVPGALALIFEWQL